jgi:hypothetical protein
VLDMEQRAGQALRVALRDARGGWVTGRHRDSADLTLRELLAAADGIYSWVV